MTAGGFVRLALPHEAAAITELQRAVLAEPTHPYASLLAQMPADEMERVWHEAITRPPLASYRVLVATEGQGAAAPVVGMIVVTPSSDADADSDDGEVADLLVHPDRRGQGHGTRLVHAAVDTMRADGFARARWWLVSTDDALRALLTSMGWATDGAHAQQQIDDAVVLKLVRLHTDISEPVEP